MKTKINLSLYGFWKKYLKGFMGYESFRREYMNIMHEKEFADTFGRYLARKLTPKQVELLRKEFLG